MTIIEQIKAEIEMRIIILREDEIVRQNCSTDFLEGKIFGYEEVLSFLDTLETEKPMEGLEVELDIWRYIHFNGARDGHFSGEYLERTSQLDLAHHFAQWQKEQMMKEAVEGIVAESYGYEKNEDGDWVQVVSPIIRINVEKYSLGDKVRIIIVKEDEK